MAAFNVPAYTDFEAYFVRDFAYDNVGTDPTKVQIADIQNAMIQAGVNWNPSLWSDQASFTLGYLLLSAHYMVMSLRRSSQGVASTGSFIMSNKGVGSVNAGFSIPQRYLDNPYFAQLALTGYGQDYLTMLIPQLSGQMFVLNADANP